MRIKTRFLTTLLPMTLIPLALIIGLAYFQVQTTFQEVESQRLRANIKQARERVIQKFEEQSDKLGIITNSINVDSLTDSTTRKLTLETKKRMLEFIDTDPYILALTHLDEKGEVLNEVIGNEGADIDKRLLDESFERAAKYGFTHSRVKEGKKGKKTMMLVRLTDSPEKDGFWLATLDTRFLYNTFGDLLREGNILEVADKRGGVIYSSKSGDKRKKQLLTDSEIPIDGANAVVFRRRIRNLGKEYLVSIFPFWSIDRPRTMTLRPEDQWVITILEPERTPPGLVTYQIIFGLITLFATLVVISLSFWVSKRITNPIEEISLATNLIAKGKGDQKQLPETGDFEVAELSRAVSRMKSDLDSYQQSLVENARLAAMGEMTSEISHEIQNKISGVSIWLQHLDSEIDPEDERQEYVDEMKLGLKSFLETLAALKTFYRKPVLESETLILDELAEEVLFETSHQADQKDIRVDSELSSRVEVTADSEKIKSVLMNLVLNAIEATPIEGTIQVSVRKTAKSAIILVEDSGDGIRISDREKVFQPFYTTNESGSGLGLGISKNNVLAHGGSISIEDSSLGGAAFIVELPLRQEDAKNTDS